MGINKTWNATLAFRKFRDKTHELSKIYWVQQIGADYLSDILPKLPPDSNTAKELKCSFDFRMYPATAKETLAWIPTYMDRNRLYLLVVYTAFLESYLKEITFLHLASIGHASNLGTSNETIQLSPIGKALGAPILRSSTVPDMIKYASSLFEVDFGKNAEDWVKLYQLRCEVAHNGGIATPNFLKKTSGFKLAANPKEYEMMGLTWEELRASMKAADEIAATIDIKVASYALCLIETEQALRETKLMNALPKRTELWRYVHDEFGLKIKHKDRPELERKFY